MSQLSDKLANEYKVLHILWCQLDRTWRLQFYKIIFLNFISAVLEVFSIATVIPFVLVIIDPEQLNEIQILSNLLDLGHQNQKNDPAVLIAFTFSVIIISSMLIRLYAIRANANFSFRLGNEISSRLFKKILWRSYGDFKQINSSVDISKLTAKINITITSLLFPFTQLWSALIILFVMVVTALIASPVLTASIFLLLTVVYLLTTKFFSSRLRRNGLIISNALDKQYRIAKESISCIKDLILNDTRNAAHIDFTKTDKEIRDRQASNIFLSQAPRFIIEAYTMLAIIIIIVLFSYNSEGAANKMVVPVFAAIAAALQRTLPVMQQAYRSWANIEGNLESFRVVLGMLDKNFSASNPKEERSKHIADIKFNSSIELKNVSYSHSNSNNRTLKSINLKIKKGEKIGFIGSTGSGKSTLIDLIMGLLVPDTGYIQVDDVKINFLNVAEWQRIISHMPQNVYLLDDSFYSNIAFSDFGKLADKQKAEWAARNACADNFILERQGMFNCLVGEQGSKLSGGQIQRLGIARCLYKNSSLIVLDEATSALDSATEETVMKNIYNLNQTVLIIAHRLSSIRGCDRIVELESGRIKRIGTYDEVIGNHSDNAFPADIAKQS